MNVGDCIDYVVEAMHMMLLESLTPILVWQKQLRTGDRTSTGKTRQCGTSKI